MQTVIANLLVIFFMLACLALLGYVANKVFDVLIAAARRGEDYRQYLLFKSRRALSYQSDKQATECYPVPMEPIAAIKMQRLNNIGAKVCGLVLEIDGKTFELRSSGQQIHTGLYAHEVNNA